MRGYSVAGVAAIFLLLAVLTSLAATNLNSSRSNNYRLISEPVIVSSTQATGILADLETATQQSQGRINLEAAVSQVLTKYGLQSQIKKIIIQRANSTRPLTTIIILSNPADETQALAVSDEGAPGKKTN